MLLRLYIYLSSLKKQNNFVSFYDIYYEIIKKKKILKQDIIKCTLMRVGLLFVTILIFSFISLFYDIHVLMGFIFFTSMLTI